MNGNEKYINNLARMVRHETISYYGQKNLAKFYEFHELLRELFPHITGACEWEEYEGSILLKWNGKNGKADEKGAGETKPVLFMNHHDVVDVADGWSHPAFSGEVFDGKLWGRGTLDTKGGLWGMLQAADELAEEGFVPENDIYFESSCCEETTYEGAEYFAQVLYDRGIRFQYVLDEGGMIMYEPIAGAKGTFAMIGMGERGCSDLRFTARDFGGHASAPDKDTALVRLGKFMQKADAAGLFEVEVAPVIEEMFRRLALSVEGPMRFVYRHPVLFNPILKSVMSKSYGTPRALVQSTIAFTMAEGSNGRNVLPTKASIIGNMRVSHHQGFESSLQAVRELAEKYDIETEVLDPAIDSPLSDYNTEEFRLMEQAVESAFPGVKPVPYIMTGCSDARFMGKLCENCYHFVPFVIDEQQLESIHANDENVDVSTLEPAVKFYKYLMERA